MNPQPSNEPELKASWLAEASFLSAFIVNETNRGKLASIVTGEMFEDERHRILYAALLRMHLEGKRINTTTLQLDLKARGELAVGGGPSYLKQLMEKAEDVKAGEEYAQAVRKQAQDLKILRACAEIHAAISSGKTETGEMSVAEIVGKLMGSLSLSDGDSSPKLIKEFLPDALDPPVNVDGAPKVGIPKIDRTFNFFVPGELTILAGRPGSGKSTFMRQLAVNAADGGDVLIYSLEVTAKTITAQMICEESRVEYSKWAAGYASADDLQRLTLGAQMVGGKPIWLSPRVDVNALDVRLQVKQLIAAGRPPRLVAIDYLLLMHHDKADRKDLEIANTTRALKQIAIECKVPILLLTQLNRDAERGGTDTEYEKPRLFHLRDSGAIEQDGDNVCFLWRRTKAEEFKKAEDRILTVEKRRNGQPVQFELLFLKDVGRFVEPTTIDRVMAGGGAA